MQTGYLSLSASSHSESSMWSMFTDLCFVLLKSSHPFTCFPMVSHTFSYAYFFNVLASTNVQASDVLQHPHKQLYRTAFHYQPAKNWMNGKPTCSAALGDDVKYAPLIYNLLMNFSVC